MHRLSQNETILLKLSNPKEDRGPAGLNRLAGCLEIKDTEKETVYLSSLESSDHDTDVQKEYQSFLM